MDKKRELLLTNGKLVKDNEIIISQKLLLKKMVQYTVNGSQNRLLIGGIRFSPQGSTSLKISLMGNKAQVEIGTLRRAIEVSLRLGNSARLHIGKNTSFRSEVAIHVSDNCQVEIGEDCMFSSNIVMRTTDSHAIYDRDNGFRINPDVNIKIGSHVWIGMGVTVLKGAIIENGSVIGAGSVISGHIPSNCIAAGNPAKVIRENIQWER